MKTNESKEAMKMNMFCATCGSFIGSQSLASSSQPHLCQACKTEFCFEDTLVIMKSSK